MEALADTLAVTHLGGWGGKTYKPYCRYISKVKTFLETGDSADYPIQLMKQCSYLEREDGVKRVRDFIA